MVGVAQTAFFGADSEQLATEQLRSLTIEYFNFKGRRISNGSSLEGTVVVSDAE
jgi:hypothetical protein